MCHSGYVKNVSLRVCLLYMISLFSTHSEGFSKNSNTCCQLSITDFRAFFTMRQWFHISKTSFFWPKNHILQKKIQNKKSQIYFIGYYRGWPDSRGCFFSWVFLIFDWAYPGPMTNIWQSFKVKSVTINSK